MFGIGFIEFVVIGLAILVFVKPKDLPKFLRKMGIIYGNLRRSYDETMDYLQELSKFEDSKEEQGTSSTQYREKASKTGSSHMNRTFSRPSTTPKKKQDSKKRDSGAKTTSQKKPLKSTKSTKQRKSTKSTKQTK